MASRFRGTCVCLHLSACSSSYALATPDKFATKPSANGTQFGVHKMKGTNENSSLYSILGKILVCICISKHGQTSRLFRSCCLLQQNCGLPIWMVPRWFPIVIRMRAFRHLPSLCPREGGRGLKCGQRAFSQSIARRIAMMLVMPVQSRVQGTTKRLRPGLVKKW